MGGFPVSATWGPGPGQPHVDQGHPAPRVVEMNVCPQGSVSIDQADCSRVVSGYAVEQKQRTEVTVRHFGGKKDEKWESMCVSVWGLTGPTGPLGWGQSGGAGTSPEGTVFLESCISELC